ncbi:MAG TPA: 8-oxo-dGTP diphosphatase MutT [Lachnospiraceae bacterium]|nr:8-oxo-dGTP diphosphatase MutT [Lachnospiraceae bacterium]
MKAISVVAAVIRNGNKIFATQRGYGDFKDRWEFPGGKIESGEEPKTALVREIKEELDTEINVGNLIKTVETDYPAFHITMYVYWCDIVKGELTLLEHEDAKWVEIDDKLAFAVDWLPADMEVVLKLLEQESLYI